ncbi:MAG: ATP-binding protein [Pseudomonadota bacterium]
MSGATRVSSLRRLWPSSMAGQLILLLVLSLIAAQVAGLVLFFDERRSALRSLQRDQVVSRTASVLRLLDATPPALQEQIVRAASAPNLQFSLQDSATVRPAEARGRLSRRLAAELKQLAPGIADKVFVLIESPRTRWLAEWWEDRDDDDDHNDHDDDDDDDKRDGKKHRSGWKGRHQLVDLSISAHLLARERWLNVKMVVPRRPQVWLPLLASLSLAAGAIALVVVIAVRRITRPLKSLATAADCLGRGQAGAAVPEVGPAEVRTAAAAFNQMRDRLDRFIGDRTRLLAAISHDLRTPITSLRLRAEFIEDPAVRDKMLETLQEMQDMTESTLAFAREEATGEGQRSVELFALLDSLIEDLRELGQDVTLSDGDKVIYLCRPVSLKRALRNIIENAAAYGGRADVSMKRQGDDVVIIVEDEGPGIAGQDRERVFEPFVRLEESRSRETGGVGLGLSIARSIVRGHGGDIGLVNRREGGLRVTVTLPLTPADGVNAQE